MFVTPQVFFFSFLSILIYLIAFCNTASHINIHHYSKVLAYCTFNCYLSHSTHYLLSQYLYFKHDKPSKRMKRLTYFQYDGQQQADHSSCSGELLPQTEQHGQHCRNILCFLACSRHDCRFPKKLSFCGIEVNVHARLLQHLFENFKNHLCTK